MAAEIDRHGRDTAPSEAAADEDMTHLPGMDHQTLKARLYFHAPKQAQSNPRALKFARPTRAQTKRAGIPSGPKLEPLVRIQLDTDIRILSGLRCSYIRFVFYPGLYPCL